MSIKLKKEVMRVGDFQKKDGTRFTITPEHLQHWKDAFSEMKSLQINVPICKDHQTDVDHTVGTVEDMETDGQSLYAILEFPDERFVDLTKTNGVSIAARPMIPTGVKTFEDAIEHIALTSRPMIPGLSGYSLVCSLNDPTEENEDDDKDKTPQNTMPEPSPTSPPSAPAPKRETPPKWETPPTQVSQQVQTPTPTPVSGYALQRAMEILSEMFGIPIPAEATRTEEAAIVFLSTIAACNKAGMVQKQTLIEASANQSPETAPTQEPPTQEPPQEPSQTDEANPQDDGDSDQQPPDDQPQDDGQNPPEDQQPPNDEDDNVPENKKKKRTPGEDGIVASLNDYRRLQIESLATRCGVPLGKMQEMTNKFCSCDTQEAYFATLGEFEAFRGGLECSLNSQPHDPAGLLGTWTGSQFNPLKKNKPIFEQRGENRETQTK